MNRRKRPRVIIFASGTKTGGGSCLLRFLEEEQAGNFDAEIAAVVSNHEFGGPRTHALRYRKPFEFFTGPYVSEKYEAIIQKYGAEWVMLSGWLRPFLGHDPRKTVNSHPAPLPAFGGKGMYGIRVHEKILEAYHRREITETFFSMHFVTEEYDRGPIFFESPRIAILPNDTPETIQDAIKKQQHSYEFKILEMVVRGRIRWKDANDKDSLVFPKGYRFAPRSFAM